ncbi:MAG: class I SAM-dependent methyltransferase [Bacteroidetes bacterium]|nr:class I SAM-dependent methyltransferase [Bacteroidota bacterium]
MLDGNNPEIIEKLISELKTKSSKCQTLEELVSLTFDFKFDYFNIKPLQNKDELITLLKILSQKKPKKILEIGTAGGGTLFLLSKIASENATIISIDLPGGPFGGELYPDWKIPIFECFKEKSQKIHLLRCNSHLPSSIEKIKKIIGDEKLDFLFIDGDHTYEGVKQDFENYSKLVKLGGIIAFHDINTGPEELVGGVPKFWNEISSKFFVSELKDEKKFHSYGIGILFFEPLKTMSTPYKKMIETVLDIQNKKIENFRNKFEKPNDIINTHPFSALLNIYSGREDLQNQFPEAKEGDFRNLLSWAIDFGIKEYEDVLKQEKVLSENELIKSKLETDLEITLNLINSEKTKILERLSSLKAKREEFEKILKTALETTSRQEEITSGFKKFTQLQSFEKELENKRQLSQELYLKESEIKNKIEQRRIELEASARELKSKVHDRKAKSEMKNGLPSVRS